MRGAIIQTLQPAIRSRRLRQHYGFECHQPFDPVEHAGFKSFECVFGGTRLKDSLQWAAKMVRTANFIVIDTEQLRGYGFHVFIPQFSL
ncbi:hypothetical protein ABW21_db0204127 [Orbilia brochopaga]|nr:hypothetical protein ABW21_db0204127 [Drechslerella brochopaga]